jgi:hypothetical protein
MAWALLASPTCQRNGLGSTRCSPFLRNNRTADSNRSLSVVVTVRGNGIFATETKAFAETKCSYTQGLTSGLFAREIYKLARSSMLKASDFPDQCESPRTGGDLWPDIGSIATAWLARSANGDFPEGESNYNSASCSSFVLCLCT